jgi:hypothetical protein
MRHPNQPIIFLLIHYLRFFSSQIQGLAHQNEVLANCVCSSLIGGRQRGGHDTIGTDVLSDYNATIHHLLPIDFTLSRVRLLES